MTAKDYAVKVEDLTKEFVLPHQRVSTIKSKIVSLFRKFDRESQLAVNKVSFEVKKGEFFGIVGRNGSGKSTLLKCIAGIYAPNKGKVNINGKLVPFIELGVGFNPELSGRDNVFLNGALLGFNTKQIETMYKEIVEFAQLAEFMDQKLKNYSSGMQVRLAFSIAIRAHGDILLLDEVLAVGDSAFQRKCLDYFDDVKKSDKTVILVTHSMPIVEKYCDRALMLEDSKILAIGSPMEIALQYELANSSISLDAAKKHRPRDPHIKIKGVLVRSQKGPTEQYTLKDDLIIDVELEVKKPDTIQLNLGLFSFEGDNIANINSTQDLPRLRPTVGTHRLTCHIKAGQFTKGMYRLNVIVYTDNEKQPQLIDVVSSDYGVHSPIVTFVEKSPNRSGKFLLTGNWQSRE